MAKKAEKGGPSFEENMRRLEAIVDQLEKGVEIEEAMALYEEGMKLSKALEERLGNMERKVYQVKNMDKLVSGTDKEVDVDLFK
jgi:exodeoxyribonuclease VII small subunit